ncbi:MAG: hypothetical protein ACD_76C00151G0007 [uncultured bacterium]|nr:MAG: hypothetical protein ACD_76C00151G0007 [uncultured bacterium]HBD04877.1 UMP kinase [Candidatus Uhrbacteria bacterium]
MKNHSVKHARRTSGAVGYRTPSRLRIFRKGEKFSVQTKTARYKTIVVSLGGSLVVPANSGPDTAFLKRFSECVRTHVRAGYRFVIVSGGGKTARLYIDSARKIQGITRDDLDWIGIHATRLNAHLLRTIFRDIAHPRVFRNPNHIPNPLPNQVTIAAGWKPGWSTDYVAVRIARGIGAKAVVNLSNVDFLYDKDPNKHKNAKKIKEISWEDYRKMVGDEWDPGLNLPFDPVASRLAQRSGLQVALIGGKNLENIDKFIKGEDFLGTLMR